MSTGHRTHSLYRPANTPLHRLAPQCKIVAMLGFVLVVVATPPQRVWAFGAYAALLAAVAAVAAVPALLIVRRMLIEVPFVAFALLLPVLTPGPRIEVLGVALSGPGLLGAWNILAKGTLGVVASILLAATTEPRALLLGVERLRLPPLLVQIMSFMLRYADVVTSELHRMRIARESRGFRARDPRQWGVLAQSAGTLFIRSYERGERVHLAMLSRGYSGRMPVAGDAGARAHEWLAAAALPSLALAVALAARVSSA